MTSSFDQILHAAKALSEPERADLVDKLISTLAPENAAPLDDAWLAEIARRSEEIDSGKVQTVEWEVVKKRAWERCRQIG